MRVEGKMNLTIAAIILAATAIIILTVMVALIASRTDNKPCPADDSKPRLMRPQNKKTANLYGLEMDIPAQSGTITTVQGIVIAENGTLKVKKGAER
jgi:hypothetical protein